MLIYQDMMIVVISLHDWYFQTKCTEMTNVAAEMDFALQLMFHITQLH